MRSIRKVILVGVFSGAVLGCGIDKTTGPQLADVVDTWHATRVQVASVANPATTVELVAAGATLQAVFNANLTYTSTVNLPGDPPDVSTGHIRLPRR